MDFLFSKTISKIIKWSLLIFSIVFPIVVNATIYQPGETLEPDCAPGTPSCGVAVLSQASNLTDGYILASDWNIFNNKQASLGYTPLNSAINLSDLVSASTARINLGLGTLATQSGTFSGTSSGTNTGDQTSVSGNAGTATALQSARTINGVSFDGTANITVADDTKVVGNSGITGATKTKITYDTKGLVIAGADATTADISASTNKNYVTDAGLIILGNTSGTNTGDQDLSGLLVKANNLSDLTSASTARTNLGLGTLAIQSGTFSGTSSGTNTGDQTSVSGNAGTATALLTARTINGVSFDGTGNITITADAGTLTGTTLNSGVTASSLTSVGTLGSLVLSATALTTGNALNISATSAVNGGATSNGLSLALITSADSSGTNTHQGINIIPTIGDATAGTNTVNLINTANFTGDAQVNVNAFNLGNLTSTTATENGLVLGTGWDNEIVLNDATPNFELGATDNTAVFNITDSCASGCANGGTTPNSIFELRDFATNFGGLVASGAFIDNNSFYAQEFAADTSNGITADSVTIGDDTRWYFDTTNFTMTYTAFDGTGGFGRLTAGATSGIGGMIGFGDAQNNLSLIFLKANLPVVQMKVRTNINNATNDIFWGLMDQATAPTVNDTKPANGIYFWNNNAGGAWQGVVRSAGADVGTVTCTGSISTTQFAVGRIQVESATSVRFLIDNDASDGISFSDCGVVSGANPTAALGLAIYDTHTEATGGRTIDIDYARVWQDDTVATDEQVVSAISTDIAPEAMTQYDYNGELVEGLTLIDKIKVEDPKNVLEIITDSIKKNLNLVIDNISARVIAIRGYFDEVFVKKVHTEELCVKKSDGSEVCVSGDQINSLLQNNNNIEVAPASTPVVADIPTVEQVASPDAPDATPAPLEVSEPVPAEQ